MNRLSIATCALLTLLFSSSSFATLKGYLDAIYLEDGTWKVTGWACQAGTSNNPTVTFTTGIGYTTTLGSVVVNLASEPEINALSVCNNSDTSLRFEWALPSLYMGTIFNYPIKAVASYPGETSTELTSSKLMALPSGYGADPFTTLLTASKILWFGAHADDETNVAPFLGDMCHNSITCVFAVATGGGTVRETEFDSVMTVLNGTKEDMQDWGSTSSNPNTVITDWNADYSGGDAEDWVYDIIDTVRPDYILTFDERRGVSCHGEHRAIGKLVRSAVTTHSSYSTSDVYIVNHRIRYSTGPTPHAEIGYGPDPAVFNPSYKGNKSFAYSSDYVTATAASNGSTGWDWVRDLIDEYPSQPPVVGDTHTEWKEWVQPLHSYQSATVGNDESGRLVSLQKMSDAPVSQAPFSGTCP